MLGLTLAVGTSGNTVVSVANNIVQWLTKIAVNIIWYEQSLQNSTDSNQTKQYGQHILAVRPLFGQHTVKATS